RGGGRRRRDRSHHRRRRHRRKSGGGRRRRKRSKSRSSSYSRSRTPARRTGGARPQARPLKGLGYTGSGDHRADVDEFCSKNQLDVKVVDAVEALSEADQKKIMGTDGGENSFVLIDRVKNPNAVVMSRIRKM
ncbi:unnamed protein product, partial [Polarella glacialis]